MKARYIILPLLILAWGCSKLTSSEPLDFSPSREQRSSEYMENLLAFKAKKSHKVSVAIVDAVTQAPTRVNDHFTSYPDSLDYIAVKGVEPLYPSVAGEMASVRELGTRFLHVIDYSIGYDAWFEDNVELGEGFLDTLKVYTDAQLKALEAYDYDGIVISYLGKTTSDVETRAQEQFLSAVQEWTKAHSDKTVLFRGYTRNLLSNSFLSDCKYIIFVPGDNASVGQLTVAVSAQLTSGVPSDRAIVEVEIPAAVDGDKTGPTAAQAAEWVNTFSDKVSKKGICFSNAQDDYYHPERVYSEIRDGINLCNN